jgi:hypothetical protein
MRWALMLVVTLCSRGLMMQMGLMNCTQSRISTVLSINTNIVVAPTARRTLLVVPVIPIKVGCLLLKQILNVSNSKCLILAFSSNYSLVQDVVKLVKSSKFSFLFA